MKLIEFYYNTTRTIAGRKKPTLFSFLKIENCIIIINLVICEINIFFISLNIKCLEKIKPKIFKEKI